MKVAALHNGGMKKKYKQLIVKIDEKIAQPESRYV